MADKETGLTPVQEFYKGKTIFVTGGSGFMGKVSLFCSEYNKKNIFNFFFALFPCKKGPIRKITVCLF